MAINDGSEIPKIYGSENIDDSYGGGSGKRVVNDFFYSNMERSSIEKIDSEVERLILRRLSAMEANNGKTNMVLYAMFTILILILLLIVVKN